MFRIHHSGERCKRGHGFGKPGGFTLTELLIVIAIIIVLAGLLLPAVARAREKGRQAFCKNNLYQFSLAITMYRDEHQSEFPPWLSTLYTTDGRLGIASPKSFICKSDKSLGRDGSRPNWNSVGLTPVQWIDVFGAGPLGPYEYNETDDTNKTAGITRASYLYEFSDVWCSWYAASLAPWCDWPGPGMGPTNGATWMQVKTHQLHHGDPSSRRPYAETLFPIVRCFHHFQERAIRNSTGTNEEMTISVAVSGNVYEGPLTWERTPPNL